MDRKDVEVRRESSRNQMFSMMPEFDDMLEQFFGRGFQSGFGEWPAFQRGGVTHVQENDKHYLLTVEIPGIPEEDIEIHLNGNLLTLRAEHRDEERGKRRRFRSFHQSFSLPSTVDPEKIEARYENGILELILPKTEKSQARRIEVQAGRKEHLRGSQGEDRKIDSPDSSMKH